MTRWFSPERERAWRSEIVARARSARFNAPAWVLCPRDGVRRSLERDLADRGGAFARFVNLDELALSLDARLGLAFARSPTEHDRAGALEQCLASRAVVLSGDGAAGMFRTALALLPVIDRLRAHHWDGRAVPSSPPSLTPGAATLVESHVELLGDLLQELEASLMASGSLDTVGRLRRAVAALSRVDSKLDGLLMVDGLDRLTALERDLLAALRSSGIEVCVAPWVEGWTDHSPDITPPEHARGVLGALETGAPSALLDDGSVTLTTARDPIEEAELVARWIAERCARGSSPDAHAVLVEATGGALDRMRRALERYGVPAHGAGVIAARETTAWQVFRASVRLAWLGVDVVDLTAVLAAPGAGVWGGDRDRLFAMLRRETPADWPSVRALLAKFASPPTVATGEEDETAPTPEELARLAQFEETRRRAEELIDVWAAKGPLRALPPHARLGALREAVKATLARFMNPVRFADAIVDLRTQTLWIEAASRVSEAALAALARWDATGAALPAEEPEAWLSDVAAMLGPVTDGAGQLRGDGVQILTGDAIGQRRPSTLVITGFHRGRFPAATPRDLLLGPLERAWLATLSPDLAALPDEASLAEAARRETVRALTLASERVLLVAPRHTVDGAEVDVALAWRDLVAMLPEAARKTVSTPSLRAYIDRDLGATRRTARARRDQSLHALAKGDLTAALTHARSVSGSVATRDLFAAMTAPDRRFDVGDLVRAKLDETVYTPQSLETLLTCRYAFLTGTLLGLRPLRLARGPALAPGDRARVAHAALRHLDAHEGPADDAALRAAIDAAVEQELPWAAAAAQRMPVMELRRAVERFLRRYGDLRRSLGFDAPKEPRPESVEPVVIPLPGERAKAMKVKPGAMRVETAEVGGRAVLVDLRSGGRRPAKALLEAGLDVEAAIAPMVAEASSGASVAAVLRVSVSRARGEFVPRAKESPRDEHRERVLGDIARRLDALGDGRAEYPPLDEPRAQELERLGASPCPRCAMRLGCRLRLPGGGA